MPFNSVVLLIVEDFSSLFSVVLAYYEITSLRSFSRNYINEFQ